MTRMKIFLLINIIGIIWDMVNSCDHGNCDVSYLEVIGSQSCVPNRLYCGDQLDGALSRSHTNFLLRRRAENILLRCNENGTYADIVDICNRGCFHHSNSDAFCKCHARQTVCGQTLLDMGWHGQRNNSLYQCTENGANVTILSNCPNGICTSTYYEHCTCSPGRLYCGHELYLFGWNNVGMNAGKLARCQNSTSIEWLADCASCNREKETTYCQCTPNKTYCGYKLNEMQLGQYENSTLYYCQADGRNASEIGRCPSSMCKDHFCVCIPGKNYCGHDFKRGSPKKFMHSLYRCIDGSKTAWKIACHTCLSSNPSPLCLCKDSAKYCGYELDGSGYWYRDQSLYQCERGKNATYITSCHSGCTKNSQNSFCGSECTPGMLYCGTKLNSIGMNDYENRTLYQCQAEGRNASRIGDCPSTCNDHFCQCVVGKNYCGHELKKNLGWKDAKIDQGLYRCTNGNNAASIQNCVSCIRHNISPLCSCEDNFYYCGSKLDGSGYWYKNNTLYQCGRNGNASYVMNCTRGCDSSQPQSACIGECVAGTNYCGARLAAMGFVGYNSTALYRCDQDGTHASLVEICQSSCRHDRCECLPGKLYCGHELTSKLGWKSQIKLPQSLHRCNTGLDTTWISDCSNCYRNEEGHPFCKCVSANRYCGNELDGSGNWYENNTLYQCDGLSLQHHPRHTKYCANNCVHVNGYSFCAHECAPGMLYCGSKLAAMGWKDLDKEMVYECSDDGKTVNSTRNSSSSCSKPCIPEHTYCGHEIQSQQPISPYNLNRLYKCGADFEFRGIADCGRCTAQSPNSYCNCVPGWRYCGKWLNKFGSVGYDNRTIYSCTNEGRPGQSIETCQDAECRGNVHNGHCPCAAGKSYCGHEKPRDYNGPLGTDLDPRVIYLCSADKEHLLQQKLCKDACVPNPAQCQQLCVVNRFYCGSDLIQLEGWKRKNIDRDLLYQCSDGTNALVKENCTAGCQTQEGGNAFCKGLPIAWYWLIIAITVPSLFVLLVAFLIHTLIRQRRLAKFLHRRRIDGSQLTSIRKLGNGAFGEVWLGKFKPETNKQPIEVALKISKHHLGQNKSSLASADAFFQESVALEFLSHKNITAAFGICSNFKGENGVTTPVLVLEYMNGGNACDYILFERQHLVQQDVIKILIDIATGCKHISKMGVVHRDIGARNVLVRKIMDTGQPVIAKLTDFGLAKDIVKGTELYKSVNPDRAMFHPRYTAPEGFDGSFSTKSDVWSFGVFMWEVYTMMDPDEKDPPVPYFWLSGNEVLNSIRNGHKLHRPALAPNEIYEVMDLCWSLKQDARPTFHELLRSLLSKSNINFGITNPSDVNAESDATSACDKKNLEVTRINDHDDAGLDDGYGHPMTTNNSTDYSDGDGDYKRASSIQLHELTACIPDDPVMIDSCL